MEQDLVYARELLSSGGYTCVVCRGSTTYTATERGVKPLLVWLEEGADFSCASAADKVVGKAAAMLYCLLRVRAVHAGVLSKPARQVLERQGVAVTWDTLVEAIENRTKTGLCPMEQATALIDDPAGAVAVIRSKLRELNQQ